jgi:hypothetical protein
MGKILDLFLKTPLARRYAAGYIERLLIALGVAAAGWLQMEAAHYESELAKFAAEVTPYVVATLFALLARQRMKKAELTIAVAQAAPAFTPRREIDQQVQSILRTDPPPQ